MNYHLLMSRIVTALAHTANGSTTNLDPVRPGAGHPSRLLTDPHVLRAEECQKCQATTDGRAYCRSCGVEVEIVYASPYWLQDRWFEAISEASKRSLVRLALDLLRAATVRNRARYDTATLEGRMAVGWLMVSGQLTTAAAARTYSMSERQMWRWRADAREHPNAARIAWEQSEAKFDPDMKHQKLDKQI